MRKLAVVASISLLICGGQAFGAIADRTFTDLGNVGGHMEVFGVSNYDTVGGPILTGRAKFDSDLDGTQDPGTLATANPFSWQSGSGFTALPVPDTTAGHGGGFGISANGNRIAGWDTNLNGLSYTGGALASTAGHWYRNVSPDGTMLVGDNRSTNVGVYNNGSGPVTMSGTVIAFGVSQDGRYVTGKGGANGQGFIYDTTAPAATALTSLTYPDFRVGDLTYMRDIVELDNGLRVVAGHGQKNLVRYAIAMREQADGSWKRFNIKGAVDAKMCDISDDGNLIFMNLYDYSAAKQKTPYVMKHTWNLEEITGLAGHAGIEAYWPMTLVDYLNSKHVANVPAAINMSADSGAMSPDGLVFAGSVGTTSAWIVTIPEPATLSFLLIGGLAMLRRRR